MLSYLKKLFRSAENPSRPINQFSFSTGAAGVHVDEQSALKYSAVFAAINRISTDVASLSIKVYERLTTGGKQPAPDNSIYDLIHFSPDGVLSSFRWRQALMGHVLAWGNGYSEIIRDGAGRPAKLILLPPNQIRPELRDGELLYRHNNRIIPAYNMLHVAGLGFDGAQGYSPIRMAQQNIALGLAAETFGASFFQNAARPAGILTSTKELKQQARINLRDSWQAAHGGPFNTGATALLEDGVTWQSIGIPPEDAQYLQTRQFQVVEIARLYSLPPHKIGDYSRATFSNIEEANADYIDTSLRSWCDSLEGELNLKLFDRDERRRFFIEHNFMSLLRANSQVRAQYFSTARQNGWMNVDEIRAVENMNPLPNGEGQVYLSPLNMVPTDQITDPPPQQPTPPPAPPDDVATNAVREVVLDGIRRLIRREASAIRRALPKPGFKDWCEIFFASHEENILEQLSPAITAFSEVTHRKINLEKLAKDWCSESRTTLLEIDEVSLPEQRAAAIEPVLTAWEASRAENLFVAS